jgi:hypothetical protein
VSIEQSLHMTCGDDALTKEYVAKAQVRPFPRFFRCDRVELTFAARAGLLGRRQGLLFGTADAPYD